VSLASFLRSYATEHHVFRAAVLSILLTLAVGPDAKQLCMAWCDAQAAAASGCHHEAPATPLSVAGDDCCDDGMLGVGEFLLQDVRRGVPSPDEGHAIPGPRYQVGWSTIVARPGHEPGREWSLEQRSLPTVLRI